MRDEIVELAKDLVALWESPKIQGLPRSERNSAIDDTRRKLIAAVHDLEANGDEHSQEASEAKAPV